MHFNKNVPKEWRADFAIDLQSLGAIVRKRSDFQTKSIPLYIPNLMSNDRKNSNNVSIGKSPQTCVVIFEDASNFHNDVQFYRRPEAITAR